MSNDAERSAEWTAMARQAVTRERAIRVAIELADSNGIEGASLRKLAIELEITPMSLYYHVANKDDLLDGMLDVIYGAIHSPQPGDDWRAALTLRAESTRDAFSRHRWAISIDARKTPGTQTLAHLDAVIGCLLAAGFSMPLIGHALAVLDSFVHGFAVHEAALPLDPGGDIGEATSDILEQQDDMAADFPHLSEMAATLILKPGYAFANEFAFGLELFLDGIERARATHDV